MSSIANFFTSYDDSDKEDQDIMEKEAMHDAEYGGRSPKCVEQSGGGYQTVFFPNVLDEDKFVVLCVIDRVLEQIDIERGYVWQHELLEEFGHCITANDITSQSRVVEYMLRNVDDDREPVETHRLTVRS